METIGDQLTAPESGWRRYDNTHVGLKYTGSWYTVTNASYYGGSVNVTTRAADNNFVNFSFYGTKIRIISDFGTDRHTDNSVTIDGVTESFNANRTTSLVNAIVYEKTGLNLGFHTVTVAVGHDRTNYIVDAIDIDETGYLTRYALTTPEAGWNRFDDMHPALKWGGSVTSVSNSTTDYNGTLHYWIGASTVGASLEFTFIGTKLRLIAGTTPTQTKEVRVSIDGNLETYNPYNATDIRQMVVYEKTGLTNTLHTVRLDSLVEGNWGVDAIDIDSTGRIFHPDEVTDPIDLTIGKRIRCYYSTNNGVVGNFAFFGQETAPFISTSAGAGGDLYFICVDKDHAGRLKLIADRNIQHSISWDAINASGVASGSGVPLPKSGYYVSMIPAMTSNTTPQGVAAASTIYSASLDAWKAFDKNTTDAGWLMEGNKWNGAWIRYTFSQPTVINKYGIKGPNSNASTDCAKSWRFEGSNDGTNWIILDTRTNQPAWSTGEYREYVFTNKATYNTYRLVYTANYGGAYVRTMAVDMFQLIEEDSMPSVDSLTLRLPTGGIHSSDKDNEWDQYIVNSTLDGKVTAGDNNVWNYNGGASWTSTTNIAGAGNRTYRGANGDAGASGYNSSSYVAAATTTGFRPVMEVTILPMYRSLIKHDGNYKKWNDNNWSTVSTTLPSENTFINEGMDDLSVLDRKSTDIVQFMTNTGDLGLGKVFKSTANLKKYIEITNLSVK